MDLEDESGAAFALELSDSDILTLLKKPIEESTVYWEDTQKLKSIRRSNMNMWLPNHWADKDIYDYQEGNMYQENRAFVSVETIVSVCNSRIAQPEIMPAQDTMVSMQIAKDVTKSVEAYAEKYQISDLFRLQVRNLLLKRAGFIKLRFDPSIGEFGDVVSESIDPADIIVDKDAKMNEIPRFIAQRIKNKTGEELLAMFPESQQVIYEILGVNRRDSKGNLVAYKTQLSRKITVWEVWFKYFEGSKLMSGLCVADEHFANIIHKEKNPNWNYDAKKGRTANLLDNPEPPFIGINWLNDGSSYIDQTSMMEQAAPLQNILDKRGFQIMENADQSGSGMVFNTTMITKEDISKLIGSPDEKVGVKGDVRSAMARISPPQLPNYVIEDKNDLRYAIDNIFGTHDISRGESSKNVTLGQDKLQQQQDYTRMDEVGRAVEKMATKFYRYLLQMFKVYYTEDHYFKAVGEDGQFDFIILNSDLIEDGIDVSVQAGSTQPISKGSQQKWVSDLVSKNMIDPLTVYEVANGGNMPSPKKMLERFMLYTASPDQFMQNVKEEEFSRAAFKDIQILNAEEVPLPRDEYDGTYFKFMNNYMATGDFAKQSEKSKQYYIEYLRMAQQQAQVQLEALMTQMPTQEELDAVAQKEAEQQQVANQAMPPQDNQATPVAPTKTGEVNYNADQTKPQASKESGKPKPKMM
jgi:hypothetical protein